MNQNPEGTDNSIIRGDEFKDVGDSCLSPDKVAEGDSGVKKEPGNQAAFKLAMKCFTSPRRKSDSLEGDDQDLFLEGQGDEGESIEHSMGKKDR